MRKENSMGGREFDFSQKEKKDKVYLRQHTWISIRELKSNLSWLADEEVKKIINDSADSRCLNLETHGQNDNLRIFMGGPEEERIWNYEIPLTIAKFKEIYPQAQFIETVERENEEKNKEIIADRKNAEDILFMSLERVAIEMYPELKIGDGLVAFRTLRYWKNKNFKPIWCEILWYDEKNPTQGVKNVEIPMNIYDEDSALNKYKNAVELYNKIIQEALDKPETTYKAFHLNDETGLVEVGGYNWPIQDIIDNNYQAGFSSEYTDEEIDDFFMEQYKRGGLSQKKIYSLKSRVNTSTKFSYSRTFDDEVYPKKTKQNEL